MSARKNMTLQMFHDGPDQILSSHSSTRVPAVVADTLSSPEAYWKVSEIIKISNTFMLGL